MCANALERVGFIGLLFIVIACNGNDNGEHSKTQKVSMNDTLKTEGCQDKINTAIGSVMELKLKAVPATGYQWLLKEPSQVLQLLDADSLKFAYPDTNQPVPGQPGYQLLHFKAMKKGEETIQLEYKRTWEKEIADSCRIRIEVN